MTGRIFEKAAGRTEPDLTRLREAVPQILAEAERRRLRAARAGQLEAVIPIARWAIPRLAALATLIVLAATLVGWRGASATTLPRNGSEIEQLILTGSGGEGSSDLLLEAMTREDEDHG